MGEDRRSLREYQSFDRILGDDLPSWVDWEDEDADDGEDLEERADHWLEDAFSEVDRSTPEGLIPDDFDGDQLTVTACQRRCDSCDATVTRRYHEDCTAPIIRINGNWRCGGCGGPVRTQSTCERCGADLERTEVEAPLDLRCTENATAVEEAIHEETNARRTDNGLAVLRYSDHLSAIALQHSRDMAERDFFDHVTPGGIEAIDRYRQFGHDDRSSGENIALIHPNSIDTPEEAAREVVNEWMDSPGHRENILRSRFDEEGIGVYLDPSGALYATQNFY